MNWMRMTDGELAGTFARLAGLGDDADEAFGELVRRYRAMVLRTSRRVTGNAQDAEDATQQVFLTLASKAGDLGHCRTLAGWLYNTAWHTSRRLRRSHDIRRRYEPRAHRAIAVEFDGQPDEDLLRELYRAIEMLPPEYCEAIVLHHLHGLTVQQVSDLMACSSGTTSARLSRGRAMMRQRLEWRGVLVSSGVLDAMLVSEELHEEALPDFIASVPISNADVAAISNQGGLAACGSMGHAAVAGMVLAASRNLVMASAVFLGGSMGVVSVGAYLNWWSPSRSVSHAIGSGSAEAQSTHAAWNDNWTRTSSSASAIPEPTCLPIVAAAGFALRRRPRRA